MAALSSISMLPSSPYWSRAASIHCLSLGFAVFSRSRSLVLGHLVAELVGGGHRITS